MKQRWRPKKWRVNIAAGRNKILNSLNIGVFLYRTDKVGMQFLSVNKFGCGLFKFADEQSFINYDWQPADVCHPDEVEYLLEELDRLVKVGDMVEHEYRLNRRDGTYIWVLCHQRVMAVDGEWRTILNSCTVIHEKKLAEEANAAKSTFLSNMSHDMRTPLNAVINIAALGRETVGLQTEIYDYLNEIELAGKYLLSLVNDILDMSRIENGKLTFVPSVYRYQEFIYYVESIINPFCKEHGVNFVWNKGTTALDLWVDKIRFNQLFFNLLSNAAKYTKPGGTVTFSLEGNKVVNGELVCDYIVSDNGIGMSREFQKIMFEPFEREEHATAYNGTGLGLAIVREIVHGMNGTINVKSELGVGTTITVHLDIPLATPEQSAQYSGIVKKEPMSAGKMARVGYEHLLIVDDNAVNRRILRRILAKRGYTADEAVNGFEAVEKIAEAKEWQYKAVLMDIRMPLMDGLMATRRIRRLDSDYARQVPIIAMTANAYASDAQVSLSAGMDAHLSKPVDPEKLFQTLERVLEPLVGN